MSKKSAVTQKGIPTKDKASNRNLAAIAKSLDTAVPTIVELLKTMRLAAASGIVLPKGLRIYKRADGDYGVVSSKADLADEAKFQKSLAFRKLYDITLEAHEGFDGVVLGEQSFRVWDYQMKTDDGKWVSPTWTTTPAQRRINALDYIVKLDAISDEVSSFAA